jgi:hypothetical protein
MTAYGQVGSLFVQSGGSFGGGGSDLHDTTSITGQTMANYGGTWQQIGVFAVLAADGGGFSWALYQRYV